MNYFIVFQNKSYKEEMKGGYLWAPQKTKKGHEIFHWTNMTKVKDGDIIFSMYKRNLVSINIANGIAVDAIRPSDLDKTNLWEEQGWLLKAEYNVLENPVSVSDNIDEILELCPRKYSPFTANGTGSQGYLFEIGRGFGEYLLKLANDINNIDINIISKEEKEYIEDMDSILDKFKDETEKERLVKSRVGQGLFKNKLLTKSCQCAICGLNIKSLLIASHCKPWGKANNKERLDVSNGLLLCPTHDALFDKGLITFKENGYIIISKQIEKDQYKLLNIDKYVRLDFISKQLPYIKYHREEEFIDNKNEIEIEPKEITDRVESLNK
ncbi:HNH endonuclease [Clostridium paraputrificum]|uniref:HNH endonuclease n=1 Tax=Clostridium paraputrificum TaxID=29363 RepID=UPI0023309E2B|nr:HNH endonuclease [Clostridium paraputrificum]MDB2073987.1 HNH endonuclease [Clostridium paraputrificum]MDB2078159.1 HNH endonuclease [Clostridium paraputrificum]